MNTGRPWILFDVGGVLEIVDDDAWHATLLDAWSLRVGLSVGDARARLRAAALPALDVSAGVETAYWQGVGSALGADVAAVERMRTEFWDAYCGTANTELIDYARSLRERAGVGILSNSADGARLQLWDCAGTANQKWRRG
jgi:putative hydrolase of the HAD superfamily